MCCCSLKLTVLQENLENMLQDVGKLSILAPHDDTYHCLTDMDKKDDVQFPPLDSNSEVAAKSILRHTCQTFKHSK